MKNCIWLRDCSLGFPEPRLLRGPQQQKENILCCWMFSREQEWKGMCLWGGKIFWRREEGSKWRNYRRKNRVNLWALWSPLMMHLGVHCSKSCKGLMGTWASLGIYTSCGVWLHPDSPRAKNLSFVNVPWRLCCQLKRYVDSFLSILFCNLN